MSCRECGSSLVDNAEYCHQCGVRRPAQQSAERRKRRRRRAAGSDVATSERKTRTRRDPWPDASRQIRAASADDEVTLWRGTYSGKAMINYWLGAVGVTVALPILAARLAPETPNLGTTIVFVLAAIWLGLLAFLFFRKIDVHYELTNQRLIHKYGILRRVTNRIEVIDVDDIVFDQGIVERLLGVGSIEVISSDETDPVMRMEGIDDVNEVAQVIDEARRVERIRRGVHIETV